MTHSRRLLFSPAVWVTIIALCITLLVLPHFQTLMASDSTYVSVYADGEEYHLVTGESSVGEILEAIKVDLHEADLVEPHIDHVVNGGLVNINVFRAKAAKVVDGSVEKVLMTPYSNPELIAQQAGFTVYPEDEFTSSVSTEFVREGFAGTKITIDRAVPVTVSIDGLSLEVRSQKTTIGDVLAEQGITLRNEDFTRPSRATHIQAGMDVEVIRVGREVVSEEREIPFETITVTDYNKPLGLYEEKTAGQSGAELITYEVRTYNGSVAEKTEISRTMRAKPVNKVIIRGGNPNGVANTGNVELARTLAAERGWTGSQWNALYNLLWHEAKFNHYAVNPTSGACGIPQALPCSKLGPVNPDGTSAVSPRGQLEWAMNYIQARYTTPERAYQYWKCIGQCTNNYGTITKRNTWY